MAKIYVARNVLTGGIVKAFRNAHKADGYRKFLDPSTQRTTHAVDEVELDEEQPKPEMGPPHSVRATITVAVSAKIGELLRPGEKLEGSGTAQAQQWATDKIAKALGDSFQGVVEAAVEVFDEQGRRVAG
jgi:hypothetical protein